jgi:hypothetical protein
MKNLFNIKILLACVFIFGCKAKKDINKEMGYTVVESKIDKRKYQDSNSEYFAITTGQHGDQNVAERTALANAQVLFTSKMETMVQSMTEIGESSSLKNTFGKLNIEAKRTLLTKAVATESRLVDDELSYREFNGRIEYKYTGVYKIDLDDIIRGWISDQD